MATVAELEKRIDELTAQLSALTADPHTEGESAIPFVGQNVIYEYRGGLRPAFVVADEGKGKYTLNVMSTPSDGLSQPGLIQVSGVPYSDFDF